MVQKLIETALALHRRNLLAEAARLYEEVLEREPEHPDALHLLGVAALQRHDPVRALAWIDRAVAVRPRAAVYYAIRADAYRALGDWARAEQSCLDALHWRPDFPEVFNTLGVIRFSQGQAEAACDLFRVALRLRPHYPEAENNLGNALQELGNAVEALDHFRAAVRLNPALAEAQSNLGQVLLERGDPHSALPHCREAVRLRPDFADGQNNLGNVLRTLGRIAASKACYARALELNPGLALTYNNMGQALQEEGRIDEALAWYLQALERAPAAPRFHANLGSVLAEREQEDEAAAAYQTALALDPRCAEAHCGLGLLLNDEGRTDEALELVRAAVRLSPDSAHRQVDLGTLLHQAGDLPGAESCFREALRLFPRHPGALVELAMLLLEALPDDDLAALRQVLDDPETPEVRRGGVHFALAHVCDARGAYREAAEHLRQGNALRASQWSSLGTRFQPDQHTRFIDRIRASFTTELFDRVRGLGLETERPVFIFGMPRSGTSLVEQVLASHPDVFGAGELRLLRRSFQTLPALLGRTDDSFSCLSSIDGPTIKALARDHLSRLERLNAAAPRITDKMPENYLYLGLIALLFPRAKLIHCQRDPRDVALSCWMTNFHRLSWAFDPESIAHYAAQYGRLMDHWGRVLPHAWLEVDYETLVSTPEESARRLVDWCGLDWNERCLACHETRRPVRTASRRQVRQPIHTRSVGRWKNYAPALEPFFERLDMGGS